MPALPSQTWRRRATLYAKLHAAFLTCVILLQDAESGNGAYSRSCIMGLSGLVFGLIAVDNGVSGLHQRSIFGFFTVPAKVIFPAAGHIHSSWMTADSATAEEAKTPLAQVGCYREHLRHACLRDCAHVQVYSWALSWQLLMHGMSFWGHLGGLLAGQLFIRGWLMALVPSEGSF